MPGGWAETADLAAGAVGWPVTVRCRARHSSLSRTLAPCRASARMTGHRLLRRHGRAAASAHSRRAPQSPPCTLSEGSPLLTEAEVQRSFRKLFGKDRKVEADAFDKATALLDELRPESPLRVRLEQELEELREIHGADNC